MRRGRPRSSTRRFLFLVALVTLGSWYNFLREPPLTEGEMIESRSGSARESSARVIPHSQDAKEPGDPRLPLSKVDSSFTPALTKAAPATLRELSMARLRHLEVCLESETCEYSQDAPDSYDLTVSLEIASELRKLIDLTQKEMETGVNVAEETAQLARHFMASPSDDVKEAALALMSLTSPSDENMKAVLQGLSVSISGPLYEVGIKELERYTGDHQPRELDEFLFKTLQGGAHQVGLEVARKSLRFLNSRNYDEYRQVLENLSKESRTYQYLRLNLEEFERLQGGG